MTLTAVQAGAFIHHIRLLSPDPARLAAFYAEAMDMRASRIGGEWLCTGPRRRVLIGDGPAKGLGHGALACRSAAALAGLHARAAEQGLRAEPVDNPLLDDAFGVRDADGNLILFGLGRAEAAADAPKLHAPIQHLTLATRDLEAFRRFYADALGFQVTDRVLDEAGRMRTCFTTSNHEHHTIAAFLSDRQGIDHHSYETGTWDGIRDWCDHFARLGVKLMWGPGRHGPGNNLFVFVEDPDGNWIEVSAELEVIHDRGAKDWPHAPRTLNLWGQAIMRS